MGSYIYCLHFFICFGIHFISIYVKLFELKKIVIEISKMMELRNNILL